MPEIDINFLTYKQSIVKLDASPKIKNYFLNIVEEVEEEYLLASKARSKKIDPYDKPESIFTWDMAERIEKMFNLKGLAEIIRENKNKMSREVLAFYVVDELLSGKFGIFSREKYLDLGSRLSLAILTEGMTVAPIEGIKEIKIKDSPNGPYVAIYFSGPIRSAGGTEAGLVVIYVDYIRRRLGLDRYIAYEKQNDNEVSRYIEELRMYERSVGRFQYSIRDEDIAYAVRHLTVEVTGVATDDVEVVINRDLSRVETNKVRGGALRVLNDGIIGRARKLYAIVDSLNIEGWEWLQHFIKSREHEEIDELFSPNEEKEDKIVEEVIIGRPVISLKNNRASFRIRYGRQANMGISAVGLHPSVYFLLDYFIVVGSQLKVNLPGKGAITVPCSICNPPVVELDDGSVIIVDNKRKIKRIANKIKKILWLGDILISYGDFLENNYQLIKSPYVEEWWFQDLQEALKQSSFNLVKNELKVPEDPYEYISFYDALNISKIFGIPLHPRYTLRWNRLSMEQLTFLLDSLIGAKKIKNQIKISDDESLHAILRNLLIEFRVKDNHIIISGEIANMLNFLTEKWYEFAQGARHTFSFVNSSPKKLLETLLRVTLRDVEGEAISARLGRPEKIKQRETSPPIHIIFPISKYGGSKRNIIKASKEQRHIIVNLSVKYCPKCKIYTYKNYCEKCGSKTIQYRYCPYCKLITPLDRCPRCKKPTVYIKPWTIDLKELLNKKTGSLGLGLPKIIKGVEGLLNKEGVPEDLSKGFIRSFKSIYVFKDGTTRIDITNAPLHHFRIKDIHITVEQAKGLGYDVDKPESPIELYLQDIIIPYKAAKHLIKVANYVDDLLVRVYGINPYYKIRKVNDLLGKLVVGLSPHTSVGVIGRIIGFTNASVLYAHPLWHAAKRRDCDGDEDSIMLLLDVLINFSKHYLPSTSGGWMDAPLFINIIIQPEEVDTQVHNMDIANIYPKEFYELTSNNVTSKEIKEKRLIPIVEDVLNTSNKFYGYKSMGYPNRLELKINTSTYSTLNSMKKKLDHQMKVMNMIFEEEDIRKIVRSILKKHILPDIIGNLRSFTSQSFRCKKCGKIYRRPPLSGKCTRCGGELLQTVHPRNIIKYLDIGKKLLKYIKDDSYLVSRFELLEKEINQTISGMESKRVKLTDFLS